MARFQRDGAWHGSGQKPLVNWDVVDKELDKVGFDYKQPRFYSLKHVVEILSSVDPPRLVNDLREQQERLETLVDFVVQGYHGGFAKSIQNYSQILQLFNESKEQVDALKRCLNDTSRHLSAQSRQMHAQWKKGIQLSTSLKMLDDIQAVVEVPDKISEALAGKDWPTAVQHLLKGCSKLAHEDLMKVGALRKLRAEMSSVSKVIQTQILDEITSKVYFVDSVQRTDSNSQAVAVELPSISSIKLADVPGMAAAVQSASASRILNQGSAPRKEANPTVDSANKAVDLQGLVACLAQIGALGEAKAHLSMHTRSEVRVMIMRALESVPPLEDPPTSSSNPATIPKHIIAAAQVAVSKVFSCCLRALKNMGEVLQRIGNAPIHHNNAALDMLMGEQGTSFSIKGALDKPRHQRGRSTAGLLDGAAYIEAEMKQFWQVLQEELQVLIAEMLQVPQSKLSGGGASVSASSTWMGDMGDLSKKGKSGEARAVSAIEQSFRLMPVQGLDMGDPLQKTTLGTEDVVGSYRRLLLQRLGGEGSPYLTPALYVPVSHFVDKAQKIINTALGVVEEAEAGLRSRQSITRRDPIVASSVWIKQFVEDFVVGTFLPQAWVDLRARCTKALEQEDAFKAQVGFTGTPSKDQQQPIMPAARFTEEIITDISNWVTAMPFFTSNLVGVVENILGRVLEAFTQNMQTVMGNSRAGRLAARTDISTIMATEVDAYLLGSLVMFYIPKSHDNFEAQAFVAAVRSQGATEADVAESEILQFIFRERPSSTDQLLSCGSSNKLVTLAVLSESLEYVANAISRLAGSQGPLTQPDAAGRRLPPKDGARSAMLDSIELQVDRYRSLSGQCIRTVRLEMLLLASFHLHSLVMDSHLCEESDLKELHPCVGSLTRTLARLTEECSPCLSYTKRQYVFGCMANAGVKTIMWILPEIQEINGLGVERMVRVLSVLQPVLGSLGLGSGEPPRPENTRAFDKGRAYYSMLALPVEEMLRIAAEKPLRYSPIEWAALLQVNVPGRLLFDSHYTQLQKIIDKAYGQSAGQKVMAAFDQVKTKLQVPTEQLRAATESITSGLQSSAQQIGEFFKLTRRGR